MTHRLENKSVAAGRLSPGLLKLSLCAALTFFLSAAPTQAVPGKDDDRDKVIIRVSSADETVKYIGDLLGGIDIESGKYTDRRSGSIKVGIFAEEDAEGTIKNVKYHKKVMYPDKDFKPGTVKFLKRAFLYEDLEDIFKKKLKTSKATKDKILRRQKLLRLLSWCDANFLPGFKSKVEKELKKLDPDVVEDEKSEKFFKYDDEQKKLVDELQALKDIKKVSLASSEHITIASDFLPIKTIERMLKTGERIFRDFTEIMYVDGINDLRKIPEGEICRIFFLTHTTTLEEALRNQSKFGPGLSDMKHAESLKLTLHLGGNSGSATQPKTQKTINFRFSALETRDLDDPDDLSKIKTRPESADYTTSVVGTLANSMMDNWLGRPPAFKQRITMPWLSQGFSHYVCIMNLGERAPFTTDFDFSYARSETGLGYRWEGDIAETMHRVAQDPSADKIEDLFRITHYRNLKTESVAKSVSLIDFLMENNKLGFLNFLKDLQKHYRKLDKTGNQTAFIKGLDPLFAKHFGAGSAEDSGMSSRLRKRASATIDSVKSLESAWRDWAAKWVNKKKKR